VKVLIVEHDDSEDPRIHRHTIIHARDDAQDWITRYLDDVERDIP
jgi:hypothetical protein